MLLALVVAALVQTPPPPHRVLIRDVTIISPERKAPLRQGYVVLENDRIAAVGHGAPPAGRWDSVVVGRGRVLIPGLIDGHTHLADAAGLPLPVPPELQPLAAAYAEQLPRSYLYAGFTTVIDLIAFDRAFLDRFKAAPLHPDSYDCGNALALAAATRYLVSRGGRLVFGSDTPSGPTYGNPPGLNGFLELERLAAAGVPLPRLLEGATIEAARAFHLDSLYGTVEAGKVANLLLLRANPLETVEPYDAIDLVVVRGKVVDRAALAAR